MTDKWTEQEIENDFADLHGSVYETEIIDERREAFRAWLQVVIRKNRAAAWTEGYRRGRMDHCDFSGDYLGEFCDVSSTNPYWLFA